LPVARVHNVRPVEAHDLDAALDALRARGLRASAARRLVLEVLYESGDPLTAEQVAAGLGERSDVASVYRNLDTLEGVGLVRHFHLGHGPGLYVLAGTGAREFMACEACGRVRAVDPSKLDAVRDRIRRDHGWEARFTHFPISGLCPACARGPAGTAKGEVQHAHP
jgi:Fur family transcriptional regulator, ferric uptake regulator